METLGRLPKTDHYVIAYSGGRDSHVLLHLLATLFGKRSRLRLSAVHVNHGLQSGAGIWAAHCVDVCRQLGIPCTVLELELIPSKGESLEAQARKARYQALKEIVEAGDLLMTAHHQADQAETVLLQLLRGAGPTGLSAMPELTGFGCGYLARPLLETGVSEIDDYAHSEQLNWIEDPTNQSLQFDRNFLRNRVIPLLRQRWPALAKTFSRSARHCAETQELVNSMAEVNLESMWDRSDHTLALSALSMLPSPQARAVVRAWISGEGFPIPGTVRLERVLHEMSTAGRDRNPVVHWPGTEIRRFRDKLYIMQPLAPMTGDCSLDWDGSSTLQLPAGTGRLEVGKGEGGLCLSRWRTGRIEIRFQSGKGRVRIAGRDHSTSFKNLFQQFAVPVWMRSRTPLVYLDDELAAVGNLCICEPFAVPEQEQEQGIHIRWIY